MKLPDLPWHELALAVAAIGCFWIVLSPTTPEDNVAAFGLLGVIIARLVKD